MEGGLASTPVDGRSVLLLQQYITEHVHLSVQEEIDRLTHQSGDPFQFLQFQAERGDVESQVKLQISYSNNILILIIYFYKKYIPVLAT